MSSGALVDGVCVDAASAPDLYWSRSLPTVSGSPAVLSLVEYIPSGWVLSSYSGGSLIAQAPVQPVAFPACDLAAGAVDGASLGFAVVGVWAAVYGVMVLKRALQ